MIIVPVRLSEIREDGVLCRLGSEPTESAEERLVPGECILKKSSVDGSDLMVLVIDQNKAPEEIRRALGLG